VKGIVKVKRFISAVDSHTEGQPARVVIGGVPYIPGNTFTEKWLWSKKNLDKLRRWLMFEPHGHANMSGTYITAPCTPGTDFGVIFIEVSGSWPMCGHGTIAAATVAVETGIVPKVEPFTYINLDTAAGVVRVKVEVKDGTAKSVELRNIPSFLYKRDLRIQVPELGSVMLDIAYGGNFYAIVEADQLNLKIEPESAGEVVRLGRMIRDAVGQQVEVVHPTKPEIRNVGMIRFVVDSETPGVTRKNAVFFSDEGIDRSPCGTGTSAEMAMRYGKGLLKLNEEFVAESIIGSKFYGNLVEETTVGGLTAVVPTIHGSAYISGFQNFILDEDDPFQVGFYLGKTSLHGENS
jgi:proline racemase